MRPGALSSEPIQRQLAGLSLRARSSPDGTAMHSLEEDRAALPSSGLAPRPLGVPNVPSMAGLCTPSGDTCAMVSTRAVLPSPGGSSASTGTTASGGSTKKVVRFSGLCEGEGVSVQLFDETEPASQCSPNNEPDHSWYARAAPATASSLRPSCASVHQPERKGSGPLPAVTHVRWNSDIARWETLVERAGRLEHLGSFEECEDAERMAWWYRSHASGSSAHADGDAPSARMACAEEHSALAVDGDGQCSVLSGTSTADSAASTVADVIVPIVFGTQRGNDGLEFHKAPSSRLECVAAEPHQAVEHESRAIARVGDRAGGTSVRKGRSVPASLGTHGMALVPSKGARVVERMKTVGPIALERERLLIPAQMCVPNAATTCIGALPAETDLVDSAIKVTPAPSDAPPLDVASDVPPLDVACAQEDPARPSGVCLDRPQDKATGTDCCAHSSQSTQTVWQRVHARLDDRAGCLVVRKPTPLSCLRHRTPSPHRDREGSCFTQRGLVQSDS